MVVMGLPAMPSMSLLTFVDHHDYSKGSIRPMCGGVAHLAILIMNSIPLLRWRGGAIGLQFLLLPAAVGRSIRGGEGCCRRFHICLDILSVPVHFWSHT